jgi:iron complex outermembrane receptor protein
VNTAADRGFGVIKTLFTQDPRNPTVQLVHDRFDTQVWAVFGQLAFDVTDTIEASLALRYDEEDRDVTSLVPAGVTQTLIDTCGLGMGTPQPINPGLCDGPIPKQSETFDEFQPKFSLTWDATDNITAFGSIGVGFKSGGFNNSGSAATIDNFINDPLINNPGSPFEGQFAPVNIQDNYKEETSLAWEVGLKTSWLDNRLRAELAYYNTQVDDMQFFEFVVGGFGLLRVVSNIDEVDIQGVEASVSFQATDWLTVYAGGNILDSEIKKNSARPDTVGNESPYSPDFTWNAGADVKFPLTDSLNFLANLEVNTVGETWFHVVQGDLRPTIFLLPSNFKVTERDAYSLVNLRAGVGGDNWTLVAFVKNALDEEYLEEVIPAPEFGGTFDHPGTERRFGVEATYRF